ncbi:VC1465 family Xer recombination activation factor [Variovorax sp. 3P27G3]|uniref:VC1465 family Xer recombination activation factor n=1 Tax=Variovorax sp. 3P27G3 TaxID=2502214 RepID=UPI0024C424FE|nr:VC1465 family Xer recombination activation factor [Variovorax sp. 3P27G3]
MSSKRPDGRPPKKNLSQRAAIAARFKVLCLDAGLKVPDVAQTLQVTERTVYAWFSGKTAVPYSAYKLLRILNRFELPGWPGWHMHSGKLWTPEGFAFDPTDGAWWSLLVRQARAFKVVYGRLTSLEVQLGEARAAQDKELATQDGAAGAAPGPAKAKLDGRRAAPPNLFLKHFRTQEGQNTPSSLEKQGSSFAITSIANWSVTANKGGLRG